MEDTHFALDDLPLDPVWTELSGRHFPDLDEWTLDEIEWKTLS